MRPTAKCKACDAPMRWVVVDGSDARMPLDAKANPAGNVWIDHWEGGTPVVKVASKDNPPPANAVLLYTSHFATCPDADRFRRG